MKHDKRTISHSPHPRAKRSLGQNFLIDKTFVERIVDALDPAPDDVVLEIGPGQGALTERLVERAGRVIALEFDRELARLLRQRFAARENFRLIEDDALSLDFTNLGVGARQLRLIANLPYNISTAILQRLFEYEDAFADCVLMFQREVVDRITASPGTKDRGFLTVLTETYFSVEKLFDVPPAAFRPVPKVWSSVVKLTPIRPVLREPKKFRALVSTGFGQKRKTILNNLKTAYANAAAILEDAAIDPGRRAETLTEGEWMRLLDASLRSQE